MFQGKRGRTIRDAYFLKPNKIGVQILAVEIYLGMLGIFLVGSSYISVV